MKLFTFLIIFIFQINYLLAINIDKDTTQIISLNDSSILTSNIDTLSVGTQENLTKPQDFSAKAITMFFAIMIFAFFAILSTLIFASHFMNIETRLDNSDSFTLVLFCIAAFIASLKKDFLESSFPTSISLNIYLHFGLVTIGIISMCFVLLLRKEKKHRQPITAITLLLSLGIFLYFILCFKNTILVK